MSLSSIRRALSHPVVKLGIGLVALAAVADVSASVACSGNREAVIDIMRNLRKGMPRTDVEQILSRHEARFFVKHPSPEGLVWWTHTGLVTAWSIGITFSSDGRLVTARVSTEDGPYHPKEVPPDIL